jgi:hypothetical protein
MLTSATSLELDLPVGDDHRTVMCGEVVASADNVTQLIPGTSTRLSHVADAELLSRTRQLVGKTNLLFAALLEHLAEVEARGLHRTRRCASLYTYCIYELRFSEDAAARRSSAAKLVRRFPVLLDAIAKGELHLTGLLMLGPHLTEANHIEVLGRAKFRTKKEIGKLVRSLSPLPDVPDRVEPLRTALQRSLRKPTWEEWVASFCPPVRELAPGERPSDWVNENGSDSADDIEAAVDKRAANEHLANRHLADWQTADTSDIVAEPPTGLTTAPARVLEVPRELPPITGPQLYQMQFTTGEEHVELIERAKALLPNKPSLGELHLQAMRLLVEALEKKRYGATQPRRRGTRRVADQSSYRGNEPIAEQPRQRTSQSIAERPCQCGEETSASSARGKGARHSSRYIPAATRRAVFERDEGRCTYLDESGRRCRETYRLHIHHVQAFARGGTHDLSTLTLRCAAHNDLAAEEDFGRAHMAAKREGGRHESLRRALGGSQGLVDEWAGAQAGRGENYSVISTSRGRLSSAVAPSSKKSPADCMPAGMQSPPATLLKSSPV